MAAWLTKLSGGGSYFGPDRFLRGENRARRDSLGQALLDPPERDALPLVCRGCSELEHDQTFEITVSPAYAWRRLGLVETDGNPTRRGVVFGFFQAGEGLAIAAALEDETYPIDDLVFDLANIRAGPRFAGEDSPLGRTTRRALSDGLRAGRSSGLSGNGRAGALRGGRCRKSSAKWSTHPAGRYKLTSDSLRHGDVERALMEWRSLLRHIAAAPDLEWERWMALKSSRAGIARPGRRRRSFFDFPPLLAAQQRRA